MVFTVFVVLFSVFCASYLSSFLATREMISVMQEYGEVVCCMGSSLNVDNLEIFNQADIR